MNIPTFRKILNVGIVSKFSSSLFTEVEPHSCQISKGILVVVKHDFHVFSCVYCDNKTSNSTARR